MRSQEEERLVRDTMVKLSQRFGLSILVLRNEANATIKLTTMADLLMSKELDPPHNTTARELVWKAYNQLSPTIKFGLGVGSSDLLVIANGRAVFLEAKSAIGRQREGQADFEEAVKRVGGHYHLFRSVEEALTAVNSVLAL